MPHLDRPRLPISWSLLDEWADAMQKQWNLVQFLIERTLIVYSMRRHLPSHLACLAVIFSNCSSVVRVPSSRQVRSLSQKMLRQWVFGSDGGPHRREAWGFVLSQVLPCHFIMSPTERALRGGSCFPRILGRPLLLDLGSVGEWRETVEL